LGYEGLSPHRFVLPNGLRVLFKQTTTTPAVTLHVAIDAGTVCDPAEAPGLANFVARTIDRGTETRTSEQVAEDLDGWGVSLMTAVSRHTLALGGTCLSEDLPQVLALVAELVRQPSFPAAEVERRRTEVVTQILQDEDNPSAVASDALMGLLYGVDHPYGRPARGGVESVKAIDRSALRAFHGRWVSPGRTCLAVVGAVDAADVESLVRAQFGDWAARRDAPPVAPPVAPPETRRFVTAAMPGKSQADIAYGFVGLTRRDPDYYAAWLMNTVLGEYALGGRLGDNLRERQGMAYYVSSALSAGPVEGPLVIRAGVSADNVERALAAIDDEVRRMRDDGPTEQEVDESRRYLVGSVPRQLETNAAIAEFLQAVEFHGLGFDHDVRLSALLARVGREDAHRAARRLLDPTRAAVAVAGPYEGTLS
jgi:zinc protease